MPLKFFCLLLFMLTATEPALAHNPASSDWQERLAAILSALLLAALLVIYLIGIRRKPPPRGLAALFHLAFLLCVLTVLGPVDEWAESNEAVHMSQHMLFMVVIAPLWVISRPLPQLIAGGGRITALLFRPFFRLTQAPMLAAYVHGAFIWFWHLPYFYTLALINPWWHGVEHACFLLSAVLFWWAVLKSAQRQAGWALLAVLFTLMHTGFLGALLTFSPTPLYGMQRDLANQQLAGLIMWVTGGIPYLAASVAIAYRWYQQLARRMNVQEVPLR